MKVLLKTCYGPLLLKKDICEKEHLKYKELSTFPSGLVYPSMLEDNKQLLIDIIEKFGCEYICGEYTHLTVVDVPKGTLYRINEYDGYEYIEYANDCEWLVAE